MRETTDGMANMVRERTSGDITMTATENSIQGSVFISRQAAVTSVGINTKATTTATLVEAEVLLNAATEGMQASGEMAAVDAGAEDEAEVQRMGTSTLTIPHRSEAIVALMRRRRGITAGPRGCSTMTFKQDLATRRKTCCIPAG